MVELQNRIKNLLLERPLNYLAAKNLSQSIDALLGLDTATVEEQIFKKEGQQNWSGLSVQTMQTPYTEFVEIVNTLSPVPGEVWVDMSAAYGRLGIVLGLIAPGVEFVGYELMEKRVVEGRKTFERLGLKDSHLLTQDLSDPQFTPLKARCYFIYDFGSQQAVEKTLHDLRDISRGQALQATLRARRAVWRARRGRLEGREGDDDHLPPRYDGFFASLAQPRHHRRTTARARVPRALTDILFRRPSQT